MPPAVDLAADKAALQHSRPGFRTVQVNGGRRRLAPAPHHTVDQATCDRAVADAYPPLGAVSPRRLMAAGASHVTDGLSAELNGHSPMATPAEN